MGRGSTRQEHPFYIDEVDGLVYVLRENPLGRPPTPVIECPSWGAAVDARREVVDAYFREQHAYVRDKRLRGVA